MSKREGHQQSHQGGERTSIMRAMSTPAQLLLLLSLVSCGQSESGCQLKEDAAQMLTVGYSVGRAEDNKEPTIYVDKIEVKLREEGAKYTDLIENKASCRKPIITIQYRKINDSDWKGISINNEGRITARTKTPYSIPNLNPCDTHEVNVSISNELVEVFKVNPYYSIDFNRPIGIENDDHYAGSKHVNITGFKDTANIKLNKICARKVVIRVFDEQDEQVSENKISLNALGNPEDEPTIKQIEGLKPCTEYEVEMEFFLISEHEKADFTSQALSFRTTPNTENLEAYTFYFEANKTLTWDFRDFVKQECSDPFDLGDTTFTINIDNTTELVEEKGSKDLGNSDSCEVNVQLDIMYTNDWEVPWEKVVFEKQVTGAKKLEDSLEEENGALVLTEDDCQEGQGELKVRWAPLRQSKNLPRMAPEEEDEEEDEEDVAVNFPGLRQKPTVSDLPLPWTSCSNRTLQVIREEEGQGRIVASTIVQHPGWVKIQPSLEVVNQNETEVTFNVPMEGCDGKGLKIEVECNIKESGSIGTSGEQEEYPILGKDADQEGSMSTESPPKVPDNNYDYPEDGPSHIFAIGDPLTLDDLKPGTEYECRAKVNGKDFESPWSNTVPIHQSPTETEPESYLDFESGNDTDATPILETSLVPEQDEKSKPEAIEDPTQEPKTAVQPDPELTTSTSSSTTTIIIVILVILMIILIILAVFFCRKKKEYTVEQMPEDPVKKEEEVVLKEVSKVSPMAPIDETPEIVIDPATPKPKEGEDAMEKDPEAGGDKTTTAEISSPPKTDTPLPDSPLSADTPEPGATPKTDNAKSGQAPKADNQEVSSNALPKSDNADNNSDPKGES